MGNISSVGSGGVPLDWGKNEPSESGKIQKSGTPDNQPSNVDGTPSVGDTFERSPELQLIDQFNTKWDAKPPERANLIDLFVTTASSNPTLLAYAALLNDDFLKELRKRMEIPDK